MSHPLSGSRKRWMLAAECIPAPSSRPLLLSYADAHGKYKLGKHQLTCATEWWQKAAEE